jgi:hypothetical protein
VRGALLALQFAFRNANHHTSGLERISKAANKREKRERLCDFAGAVMDWGATRAIHAVGSGTVSRLGRSVSSAYLVLLYASLPPANTLSVDGNTSSVENGTYGDTWRSSARYRGGTSQIPKNSRVGSIRGESQPSSNVSTTRSRAERATLIDPSREGSCAEEVAGTGRAELLDSCLRRVSEAKSLALYLLI